LTIINLHIWRTASNWIIFNCWRWADSFHFRFKFT